MSMSHKLRRLLLSLLLSTGVVGSARADLIEQLDFGGGIVNSTIPVVQRIADFSGTAIIEWGGIDQPWSNGYQPPHVVFMQPPTSLQLISVDLQVTDYTVYPYRYLSGDITTSFFNAYQRQLRAARCVLWL
jgi:hypothetical protein